MIGRGEGIGLFFPNGSCGGKLVALSGCFLSIFAAMNEGPQASQVGTRVLITGASGLVGRALTELLLAEGYGVVHLVRPGSHKRQVESKLEGGNSVVLGSNLGRDQSSLSGADAEAVKVGSGMGHLHRFDWDPEVGFIEGVS